MTVDGTIQLDIVHLVDCTVFTQLTERFLLSELYTVHPVDYTLFTQLTGHHVYCTLFTQ